MRSRWVAPLVLLLCAGCVKPPAPPVFGLPPLHPGAGGWPEKVENLQPTLRWEAFPRPADVEADREGWLSRIRDVTYDLRIWRPGTGGPAGLEHPTDLVYSRPALAATTHVVETPLAAGTVYLWSVRARFELDGRIRVTEWSVLDRHGLRPADDPRSASVPPLGYYRFRTP